MWLLLFCCLISLLAISFLSLWMCHKWKPLRAITWNKKRVCLVTVPPSGTQPQDCSGRSSDTHYRTFFFGFPREPHYRLWTEQSIVNWAWRLPFVNQTEKNQQVMWGVVPWDTADERLWETTWNLCGFVFFVCLFVLLFFNYYTDYLKYANVNVKFI